MNENEPRKQAEPHEHDYRPSSGEHPDLHDRILGCLLGGAIGDSIGAAFENETKPTFSLPKDLRVTDDTQLTIATSEAIIQAGHADPESIAARFVDWFRDRRITGIGSSTLKAIQELDAGGHWASVGATGERAAGNGAAMRIAPLAFLLNPMETIDKRTIRDICRITHHNDEAYLGALAIVYTIGRGQLDWELIESLIDRLPDSKIRDRFVEIHKRKLTTTQLGAMYSPSGYVVDSVPFAILAAVEARDFLESIELLVSCGGDTDTIASMFGQIYGSVHGTNSLPMETATNVDEFSLVTRTATGLSEVARSPRS